MAFKEEKEKEKKKKKELKRALWGEQLYGSFPVCDIELSSNQLKPCENGFQN